MNLETFISANANAIRLGAFLGVFAVMAVWEVMAPRRSLHARKLVRWINNIGLVMLNTLVLRRVFPAAALGVATWAGAQGVGLFNRIDAPHWVGVTLSLLLLDFAIWLQHVMFHAIPLLWRLHRVHHADLDIDVTTGARFHPLEILLSMLIKFTVILLLGPPLVAVVLFEVILNATAMFNHSNVKLGRVPDRLLRSILVTPDMHRVHHSIEDDETNSNFGFNLSWWDRLFGTYRAQPRATHEAMTIGISTFREPRWCSWLPGMLAIPFVGRVRDYAINRRRWGRDGES